MTAFKHFLSQPWLDRLLGGFRLQDILGAGQHSADFDHTRAAYMRTRLIFMLVFFVIAVPAWIPVDYLTLNSENFMPLALARLVLSAFLLILLLGCLLRPRPLVTHSLLMLSILASVVFYLAAMVFMRTGTTDIPLAGYRAMPMMMIALTGLFPLTLIQGLSLMGLIVASYLGLEYWSGRLLMSETLNNLWVLGLMAGVTLWIQSGQLLMLLKLYRESTRDALTGLINRRVLVKQLRLHRQQYRDQGTPFCLLMGDIDRFKRINDNHGHQVGDAVLKLAADILNRSVRPQDTVARYGGEEFMVLMPGIELAAAENLAEAVRAGFETADFHTADGTAVSVTLSSGLVTYRAEETLDSLLERVDQLLYKAKQQGRNRVVIQTTAKPD